MNQTKTKKITMLKRGFVVYHGISFFLGAAVMTTTDGCTGEENSPPAAPALSTHKR